MMLEEDATNFYNAIRRLRESVGLPDYMRDFPRGCCGNVSILLGTYLQELGYPDVYYIEGLKEDASSGRVASHAWVTCEGTLVDLTIAQYSDGKEIVVSDDSDWHSAWSQTRSEVQNVCQNADILSCTYQDILKHLD